LPPNQKDFSVNRFDVVVICASLIAGGICVLIQRSTSRIFPARNENKQPSVAIGWMLIAIGGIFMLGKLIGAW
jgi:hypothetical protein